MLTAEWDHLGEAVVAFVDDEDPFQARRPTGYRTSPDSDVEVLEVVTVYPDPWLEGFPDLEGAAQVEHVVDEAGREYLRRTWPGADFSPDALRGALGDRLRGRARAYLGLTDWYVIRALETGKAVPGEVTEERETVRAWCDERLEDLRAARPIDLLDFSTAIPFGLVTGAGIGGRP